MISLIIEVRNLWDSKDFSSREKSSLGAFQRFNRWEKSRTSESYPDLCWWSTLELRKDTIKNSGNQLQREAKNLRGSRVQAKKSRTAEGSRDITQVTACGISSYLCYIALHIGKSLTCDEVGWLAALLRAGRKSRKQEQPMRTAQTNWCVGKLQ